MKQHQKINDVVFIYEEDFKKLKEGKQGKFYKLGGELKKLCVIRRLALGKGVLKVKDIAVKLGITERQVRAWLKELEGKKMLRVVKMGNNEIYLEGLFKEKDKRGYYAVVDEVEFGLSDIAFSVLNYAKILEFRGRKWNKETLKEELGVSENSVRVALKKIEDFYKKDLREVVREWRLSQEQRKDYSNEVDDAGLSEGQGVNLEQEKEVASGFGAGGYKNRGNGGKLVKQVGNNKRDARTLEWAFNYQTGEVLRQGEELIYVYASQLNDFKKFLRDRNIRENQFRIIPVKSKSGIIPYYYVLGRGIEKIYSDFEGWLEEEKVKMLGIIA